jgi:hypothetical protein
MSADVYFSIGSTHQVCQDHAIAHDDFIVLSDGCSSAKDSDWGARFLTQAASNILKQTKPTDLGTFSKNVILAAQSYANKLEIHEDCLAATLLCAYVKDKVIKAFIIGDGYIIARNKIKNEIMVIGHNFDTGAPWYLYYTLSDDLKNGYINRFGNGKFIVNKMIVNKTVSISDNLPMDASVGMASMGYTFSLDEYDMVGLASDGLKSFVQQTKTNTSITTKSVELGEVLKKLFDFKTLTGQFVHRRCQRFLKDFAADNIKNTDDFSLGVLYV